MPLRRSGARRRAAERRSRLDRRDAPGRAEVRRAGRSDGIWVDSGSRDRPGGRLRRFVRCLTDGEPPPPDAHILFAARRFKISPQDAADLVGVRITPQTYSRLGEYATLIDVHAGWEEGGEADVKMFQAQPDLWNLYARGEDGDLMPDPSELTLLSPAAARRSDRRFPVNVRNQIVGGMAVVGAAAVGAAGVAATDGDRVQ